MQSTDSPEKISIPFAVDGAKRPIPNDSQIGIVDGAASFETGFPPKTFTPISAGGVPPFGVDFNGIFNRITDIQRWQSAGGVFGFESQYATEIGGYPMGATVANASKNGTWISTVDNNTVDPDAGASSNWISGIWFKQLGVDSKILTMQDKLFQIVSPEDFNGDTATAIERALAVSPYLKLQPGKTYTINRTVEFTGTVFIYAVGATILGDLTVFNFKDAANSMLIGGDYKNIIIPWTIVRNIVTWDNQTSADVTRSNSGYMPGPLDDDIWGGLTSDQQNQVVGPKIVFTSTSAAAQSNIQIDGVSGRFANIILEGCIYSSVRNVVIKGGKDYAAVVFYNNTNLSRLTNIDIGYKFAQGVGNTTSNVFVDGSTGCGVTFFGNTKWSMENTHGSNCGESGLKLYQKDVTFTSDDIISTYGKSNACSASNNRFDGGDFSSTYPTTGTKSGHNQISNFSAINNRATGLFSDAQSNQYSGIYSVDNGLGGCTLQAANIMVSNIYLENNTRKHGILGPINSYDLEVTGDNCTIDGVKIIRALPAPSVHSMVHQGTGGSNKNVDAPGQSVLISTTISRTVSDDNYRMSRVPTSFVQYFITDEPTDIQSVVKMWRTASTGKVASFFYGPTESPVGDISITTTNTLYGTSSDPRLKYNIKPMSGGLSFIMGLSPCTWNWLLDGSTGDGFLATELQEKKPSAVSGMKDQVDDEGKPVYQSVDPSKLIPDLVNAIQELKREFDAYKASHP